MKQIISSIAFLMIFINFSATASDFMSKYEETEGYLNKWQIRESLASAKGLLEMASTEKEITLAFSSNTIVEYYRGNYEEVLGYSEKLRNTSSTIEKNKISFLNYILKVSENLHNFDNLKTDHFEIRYFHKKDIILAEYAQEVLENSYYEIGLDLGFYPEKPIIVEIFPDLQSFTYASTLSEKDIKTTGVVGVCMFNRIMILSPRLLPQGYNWADTLAHEYTHYLLFHKSHNSVPVWLHEGIAKLEEKRWKENKRNVINPYFETILAKALRDNSLVPIEKMHPSFGKLDSSYEAQLAFAQVGTVANYLINRWGKDSISRLVEILKESGDYKASIKELTHMDFQSFYNSWISYLKEKNLQIKLPKITIRELKFINPDSITPDNRQDLISLKDIRAKNHTRLGDLLKYHGRIKASIYEYEKALSYDKYSPVILNRLASSYIEIGVPTKAVEKLIPLLNVYPNFVDTYMNLGKIYTKNKEFKKAEYIYTSALFINPFHPDIHSNLMFIYEQLGLSDMIKKEEQILDKIKDNSDNIIYD